MIPVGKYTATALDAELGITDGEGKEPTEYVAVKFQIEGGEQNGQIVFWRGRAVPAQASYATRGQYNHDRTATPSKGLR